MLPFLPILQYTKHGPKKVANRPAISASSQLPEAVTETRDEEPELVLH
jgi:hypothetical protein